MLDGISRTALLSVPLFIVGGGIETKALFGLLVHIEPQYIRAISTVAEWPRRTPPPLGRNISECFCTSITKVNK